MVCRNMTTYIGDENDMLWKSNPFYRRPEFSTCGGTSGAFRRLCDDALSFLGDTCALIAANSGTPVSVALVEDTITIALEQVFYDLSYELKKTIAGDDGVNMYNNDLDSTSLTSGDGIVGFGVDLGRMMEHSRCFQCGCHRQEPILQISDLYVPVSFNARPTGCFSKSNSVDTVNVLDSLYTVVATLASELSDTLNLSQLDLETFSSDFNILNKYLDSLIVLDANSVISKSSSNTIRKFKSDPMLNGNNEDSIVFDKLRRCENLDIVSKRPVRMDHDFRSSPKENLCFIDNSSHNVLDKNLHTNTRTHVCDNPSIDELSTSELYSTSVHFPNLKSSSVTEETLGLEDEDSVTHFNSKTDELYLYDGRTKSKLSVVYEETGEWSGEESGSVVAWRQDLWRSALYDSDEDWLWPPPSDHRHQQWFSSNDKEGRVYFFEENSNESSWALPEHDHLSIKDYKKVKSEEEDVLLANPVSDKSLSRSAKSKSMILSGPQSNCIPSSVSHNWPQLWEGHMAILKEGPLNKTKITENGKRVRKNWTSTHAVLTELLLLFFKDNKGYPAMLSGSGRPELSVDLNGAVICPGEKVSSRHNVHLLGTVLGLQVLIQSDCAATADDWLAKIQSAIDNLPSSSISVKPPRVKVESPPEEPKINTRLGRSKSVKLKQKSVSVEDLSGTNVAERQTKIKERLKKFFHRRPSVEILVKKGIFKDEPVFGCVLEQICPLEAARVPRLVQECIRCIERSEENMKTDGLYRASGNLSQVQKIRCQVDQHEYGLLDVEEDVHVLTGTLKLFFRELKQPIIPFKFFNKALNASTNQNRSEKIKHFQEIVKFLPPCNYDTLKCLLQHLLRVSQYQEYNRMHIPNIAIVFGPTLMWSEQESQNMACDLMQQNLVIECLLSDFSLVFR